MVIKLVIQRQRLPTTLPALNSKMVLLRFLLGWYVVSFINLDYELFTWPILVINYDLKIYEKESKVFHILAKAKSYLLHVPDIRQIEL